MTPLRTLARAIIGICLCSASVAQAGPVTYTAAATFHAPACNWGQTFNLDGLVAPPCGGPYEVFQFLPDGDPTSLWGTLAYYPTGAASHQAVTVSQDRRITTGGLERFPLVLEKEGDYLFGVALTHRDAGTLKDYNALAIYSFTLDLPEAPSGGGGPSVFEPGLPLEPTPEPGTLLLVGTTLAGAGLWWRMRRGR